VSTRRLRFDGVIAGLGTESGTRLVVGMWSASPFGAIADVMVEDEGGHRTLLAPRQEVADFIAATYVFDDIRVEPITLRESHGSVMLSSPSIRVELRLGRRTGVGRLLVRVPGPLRRARWWCRAIGPAARRLRPGVRTVGTAGGGRQEYYCAADEHLVESARVSFDGIELGGLRPVLPAVRFGFASAPPTPSFVRLTTLIDLPE
jgi:hypothetical protein